MSDTPSQQDTTTQLVQTLQTIAGDFTANVHVSAQQQGKNLSIVARSINQGNSAGVQMLHKVVDVLIARGSNELQASLQADEANDKIPALVCTFESSHSSEMLEKFQEALRASRMLTAREKLLTLVENEIKGNPISGPPTVAAALRWQQQALLGTAKDEEEVVLASNSTFQKQLKAIIAESIEKGIDKENLANILYEAGQNPVETARQQYNNFLDMVRDSKMPKKYGGPLH